MKMSVREARANFAAALDAAERGERVTITKNGQAVAELGPPSAQPDEEDFWVRNARVREEMGLDKMGAESLAGDKWLKEFNDPAWTRELFGPDYLDDETGDA